MRLRLALPEQTEELTMEARSVCGWTMKIACFQVRTILAAALKKAADQP
jgi:hypothetical protein